jgi:hypothetical protein
LGASVKGRVIALHARIGHELNREVVMPELQSATPRRLGWRTLQPALVALLVLCPAAVLPAQEAPQVAELTGSLTTEQGVRVLRLWGTPFQQGYTHGSLLGDRILELAEAVLLDPHVMPDVRMYESMIRDRMLPSFDLSGEQRDELLGMVRGMTDRLGAKGMTLRRLKRPLDDQDLLALNTVADWNPSACSSFAAWGSMTEGGETIVARNLDYFDLPGLREDHVLIVRLASDDSKKRWVSLAWPGIIGAYTAMNEEGVVVAMHDVVAAKVMDMGLTPRSFVLRDIMETVGAGGAIEQAEKLLRSRRAFRGNNFLVAGPFDGKTQPAAVFEYDGDLENSGGVTVRRAGEAINESPPDSVLCTNHYRLRRPPGGTCSRYESIRSALQSANGGGALDVKAAWSIIESAAVKGTMHTLVAQPNKRALELGLAAPNANACETERVGFTLEQLFAQPE